MIRVELLDQRRSPWSRALLAALVLCGGLYGIHRLFPALAGSLFSPAPQPEATPSPVEQELAPKPVERQETDPSPGQAIAPKPEAQQEATPSSGQEAPPSTVAQQEIALSPAAQQEPPPSSAAQPEADPSPVQEAISSSAAQPEATPSPVQKTDEATSTPAVQREAAPRAATPACHQVMRIDEQVPAGIRLASLNCNSTGEYWLEGTSPSHKVLRTFRLRLQALPSRVSFSVWQERRTLRFAFQGRLAEQDALPLAALSPDRAEQFFGKVARWADASGLDSLSIHEPIHKPLSPTRTHQRQKLRGIGSPEQISAFLHQLQQAEAIASLGEVLLMPVQSDESGWVKARLYAAVDILVQAP